MHTPRSMEKRCAVKSGIARVAHPVLESPLMSTRSRVARFALAALGFVFLVVGFWGSPNQPSVPSHFSLSVVMAGLLLSFTALGDGRFGNGCAATVVALVAIVALASRALFAVGVAVMPAQAQLPGVLGLIGGLGLVVSAPALILAEIAWLASALQGYRKHRERRNAEGA